MNIFTDIKSWQRTRTKLHNKKIGFIPTMGQLHAGHISLCKKAKAESDVTVVSIFVNPTQFNQAEDFEQYPRNINDDIKLLKEAEVDYLFSPSSKNIYPDNYTIQINETCVALQLEGHYRPQHFKGVLTVVLKLLNLINPHKAYFGEKDYQQLLLIKKLTKALFLPVEVISCETIRDENGLALSSRNSRLSDAARKHATHFPRLLMSDLKNAEIKRKLNALGFKVDYIENKWNRRLGAVWIEGVRLIDNVSINKS